MPVCSQLDLFFYPSFRVKVPFCFFSHIFLTKFTLFSLLLGRFYGGGGCILLFFTMFKTPPSLVLLPSFPVVNASPWEKESYDPVFLFDRFFSLSPSEFFCSDDEPPPPGYPLCHLVLHSRFVISQLCAVFCCCDARWRTRSEVPTYTSNRRSLFRSSPSATHHTNKAFLLTPPLL